MTEIKMPDLATIMTRIAKIATIARLGILQRRTPKMPEPSITPTCLAILGVEMRGTKSDLFGRTRNINNER